jgi:hypothetical protein
MPDNAGVGKVPGHIARLLLTGLLLALLAGCYPLSTRVASVGLHEQYQYVEGHDAGNKTIVGVRDAPMLADGFFFRFRRDENNSMLIGRYTVDPDGKVEPLLPVPGMDYASFAERPTGGLGSEELLIKRYRKPVAYLGLPVLVVTVAGETVITVGTLLVVSNGLPLLEKALAR